MSYRSGYSGIPDHVGEPVLFSQDHWDVIEFCAEEVRRQYAHPHATMGVAAIAVPWMLRAWERAIEASEGGEILSLALVQEWASLIEPDLNRRGHFREGGVFIGYRSAPPPRDLGLLMAEWQEALADESAMIVLVKKAVEEQWEQARMWNETYGTGISRGKQARGPNRAKATQDFPTAAYFAFEHIHPFSDGNGRAGKIIFNWLRETLERPTWPPNIWGASNP